MKWAYYQDIDEEKCAWVRELIKAGVVTDGEVDCRDIKLVTADDVRGFRRVHFFCGIGVWDYALNLARWGDREVWTGSCPCQPFSAAGKREGYNDERHAWPEWYRLISACQPAVVFGEQVSSAINGTAIENANVQALQGRETIFRVLRELQRQSPSGLQGMFTGAGTRVQALKAAAGKRALSGVAREEAGLCAGECGAVSGKEEGAAMHPRPRGHSGENRPWILRDHGDSVRSYQASLMELTVSGQDRFNEGIHPGERESDSLFLECDGERLGHPEGRGSGQCNPRAAFQAKRRIDRIFDRCFEGESSWSWLDLISADLEAAGYSRRSAVLGAHSLGAPHRRQRLYFCADTEHDGHNRPHGTEAVTDCNEPEVRIPDGDRAAGECPNAGCPSRPSEHIDKSRQRPWRKPTEDESLRAGPSSATGDGGDSTERGFAMRRSTSGNTGHAALTDEAGGSDNAIGARLEGQLRNERIWRGPGWLDPVAARSAAEAGATRGFWADCDWWYGRDGKYRPIESGLFPLAYGATNRVLKLRGYGDAINAEVAKAFIEAYMNS